MSEIDKMLAAGYAVIIYLNHIGTETMALVDGNDWTAVQAVIDDLPDEQVIDITTPTGPDAIENGIAKLGRKLRREGEYEKWDEKMKALGLPNASERPSQHTKD